ncbi:MAG: FecR domain-containing protein [Alphaproteobacteria bacterium]|nr:FecR domain-containing protein [Alphaproteobacteria bacterium]
MAREESTLRPGDNGASSEGVSGFSLEPSTAADTNAPSSSSGSPPHTDDSLISPTSASHITLTDQDLSDLAARNDSISGFEATTGADLKSDADSGAQVDIVASFDARDGDSVSLPDITYIYDADYVRQGSDLLLIKPDGTAIQIENYFAVEITPDILGAGGRRLTPELVESFLHPVAPNQMAALTENQIAQAQGNSIGTVETITGDVYAVRPDGTRVLLQAGDPVFQGDQIETADGASIKMTFIDGTLFTLGGDARLALDEMVFNPATSSGESAFSILQGGFLFVSGQIAQNNPNDMTVTTPVATIGIRGTIVTGEVSGDQLSTGETFRFTVVDGEIAVTAGSQTIVLSENFATATGNADGTGGTNLFNFVDTAQNVIARNSSQFKALTPNDLRLIENAIKTTVESKTGQSIELNLQDLVTNTPDSEPNTQNDEEDGTNSEGGGDDEEGLTERDLQGLEDSGDAGDEGGGDDGEAEPEDVGDVEVGDGTPTPDDETDPEVIIVTNPFDGSDTLGTTTGGDDNNNPNQTTGTGSTDSGEQTETPIDTKPDPLQPPIIVPVPDPTPQPIVNPPPSPNPPDNPGYNYGYSNPNTSSAITIDYSSFAGSTDSYHVETGSGGDNVTTGGGGDFVSTGAGDDTIKTNGGNDTVIAGSGNDTIVGGSGEGNDFYNGGTGYDSVTYDSVSGQNKTSLSVTLRSVSGTTSVNDSMAQIIGSDTLTNVDFIRLGHGDDTVTVLAAGIDVDGSEGRDTLDLSSIGGDVTFSFADGVFNKNSASSTFTNFEYVLGGEGNDKFTVNDISQSAGGGDGGSDTLVIGDDSLLLNLGGNVSSVFLTDGELTQTFTDFDSVEQANSTLSLGNGTYSATGAITLNTVTLDHYSAPVFAGSGTFVNSGEFRFQDSAGADLETTLDSRDGTFNLTGSLSQLDINDGGRLIIGSDTDYIANTLSALSINVNSNGTVEIASGPV